MLKNLKIAQKIHLPIIISILIGIIIIIFTSILSMRDIEKDIYKNEKNNLLTLCELPNR